ncbi:hypothetical protein [Candidatus Thioglobus sp.]|uniref:hypothetical protein n=1 Tax=Candidatus Thioglobus sp. TaxID=2026721 RepID=UPI003D11F41D
MSCFLGVCITAIQILGVRDVRGVNPTIVINTANVTHNIPDFYKIKNRQFNMKGYLILDTNTRIDFGYDGGLKSQKQTRSKASILAAS